MTRRIVAALRRRLLIATHGVRHRRELRQWRARTWPRIDEIAERERRAGRGPMVLTGIHHRIGDVVMATAVVRHLRARYPEATLLFATQARYREIVDANPNVDYVVDCDCVGSLIVLATHPAFAHVHLLTLDGDRCEFCGAVFRESYPPFVERGIGYLNWFTLRRHLVDLWLERIGISSATTAPDFYVPGDVQVRIADRLRGMIGGRAGPLIAFHTRAPHWPAKEWPHDNFIALMLRLHERLNARIVVIGSESVSGLPEGTIDMTGRTALLEIGALLSEVDLFIGLDSGPAHVASAVGTPSIVLFGPTDPATCAPRGRHVATVWHGADEDGLFAVGLRAGTAGNRDMAKIGVDEVFELARRMVGASAAILTDGGAEHA